MSINVIGAGFPRTGTNTLREALTTLGYVKTYHMKELLVHPEQLPHWTRLRETGTTDWDTLYNGYQATVDFPAYPWYKAHMKRYPDAKVILTVRPFEKWHESVYSTIWLAQNPAEEERLQMAQLIKEDPRLQSVMKVMQFAKEAIFEDHFRGKFLDKDAMQKIFDQHNAEVKAYVPAEKLLVYDVAEGWGPLCRFLGKPEPAEPLPHTNKREDFKVMLGELMRGELV